MITSVSHVLLHLIRISQEQGKKMLFKSCVKYLVPRNCFCFAVQFWHKCYLASCPISVQGMKNNEWGMKIMNFPSGFQVTSSSF